MPRRGQNDSSPGDGRQPYSDIGGPAAKHAQTHDVRREMLTNPKGPDRADDEFADDLRPMTPSTELRTHADESHSAADDKTLHKRLQDLTNDELAQLAVLQEGVRLDQGSIYLDLDDLERGPFKALGGQVAEAHNRYVAKKDVDYELWNRLAGQDREPAVERPLTEEQTASQN